MSIRKNPESLAPSYKAAAFSAPNERIARFSGLVIQHAPKKSGLRILDIGSGSGEQLISLGEQLQSSELVGVDISAPNIEAAQEKIATLKERERFRFLLCDYLDLKEEGRFDLIISYSTLHLIPVDTERLLGKLAQEMTPNGRLIFTIPYACAYNSALIMVRKLFRLIRGPVTDRIIFFLGKLVAGKPMHDSQLRERIIYMYMVPHRLDGTALRSVAARHGLRVVSESLEPHASIAQLKHNCVIMEKIDQ